LRDESASDPAIACSRSSGARGRYAAPFHAGAQEHKPTEAISAMPTFKADKAATYVANLVLNDGIVGSTATVTRAEAQEMK